ncbi:L-rhamnose-binding lectin CSL3-like [Saccostrea echinata]|uniref:L-rhamnose-binding lectin CSL3-like n=1 Tax=Saccostrea echinata TaxID=191078 RepID=UPI002A81FBB5|nr:L-rhamnose-binding lectin CSL3-like [Saccostrea echinata]
MWRILVLIAVILVIHDTDGHWWKRKKYVHKVTACEHHSMSLNCGRHRHIKVHYASYGRQNKSTCARRSASKSPSNTVCRARKSTGVVKRFCDGKRRCRLRASNSLFGDPCVGTYKYLSVKYYCKGKWHHLHGRDEKDRRDIRVSDDTMMTDEDFSN